MSKNFCIQVWTQNKQGAKGGINYLVFFQERTDISYACFPLGYLKKKVIMCI